MSVIDPGLTRLLHFYRSGPMPCPYLPGRVERKLFTRLNGPNAQALNSTLSQAGFRRSHDIIYRPVCPGCQACVPVRIPVDRFRPNRSMRRAMAANGDLVAAERPAAATPEQFRLFLRYQRSRHHDSDMARMTAADFAAMVEDGNAGSALLEFRTTAGRLYGVMLSDRLGDGFSAVYSFFEPDEPGRSLGTYMVLSLVELARARRLPYVYLGYWIADSRKMAYKMRYRPLEALTANGWETLVPEDPADAPG